MTARPAFRLEPQIDACSRKGASEHAYTGGTVPDCSVLYLCSVPHSLLICHVLFSSDNTSRCFVQYGGSTRSGSGSGSGSGPPWPGLPTYPRTSVYTRLIPPRVIHTPLTQSLRTLFLYLGDWGVVLPDRVDQCSHRCLAT
jgi:hypothetical protein